MDGREPLPAQYLRRVYAVLVDIGPVVYQFSGIFHDEPLCRRCPGRVEGRHLLRSLHDEVIPAGAVPDVHVKGGGGRAFLPVSVYEEPVVPGPLPYELLYRRRVAVEVEYHRAAQREYALEPGLVEAAGVLLGCPEDEYVYHVHRPDPPVRGLFTADTYGRHFLEREVISARPEYALRVLALVGRSTFP